MNQTDPALLNLLAAILAEMRMLRDAITPPESRMNRIRLTDVATAINRRPVWVKRRLEMLGIEPKRVGTGNELSISQVEADVFSAHILQPSIAELNKHGKPLQKAEPMTRRTPWKREDT